MSDDRKIICGDCLEVLKTLPDQSVDCCVTSPPYYGLRDYGTGKWIGGDPNCPHKRVSKYSPKTTTGHHQIELAGNVGDAIYKTVCPLCGAVREDKQIGLEETPEEYIQKLVNVFREVKRVLKDEGTLWLNIGDSYWGSGSRGFDFTDKFTEASELQKGSKGTIDLHNVPKLTGNKDGYKNKDLIGIPWMLAFALRSDGWYLRQDIIWAKPNPMPESVKDRCTKSHEYIFLLTKKPHYYFDHEAIQEPAQLSTIQRLSQDVESQEGSYTPSKNNGKMKAVASKSKYQSFVQEKSGSRIRFGGSKYGDNNDPHYATKSGKERIPQSKNSQNGEEQIVRNKRDVWSVPTQAVKEAHFATFPEKLIEPCILAGCPIGGIVLDPFFGSGTTGRVASRLDRDYIGIELNPEYIDIGMRRTNNVQIQMV